MSSQSAPVLDAVREGNAQPGASRATGSVASNSATVRMGVIGYGYWGPNIVRNLHGLDDCEVKAVCDNSPSALKRASRAYLQPATLAWAAASNSSLRPAKAPPQR